MKKKVSFGGITLGDFGFGMAGCLTTCNPAPKEKRVVLKKPKPLTDRQAKRMVLGLLDDNDDRDYEYQLHLNGSDEERLRKWASR